MRPSSAADVPAVAPAVERGVGFFETLLLVGRRPVLFERHTARMQEGLGALGLPAPGRDEIEAAAARAIVEAGEAGEAGEAALRLTWLALGADLEVRASWRLDAQVRPIPALTRRRREGSRAISLPRALQRDTPGLKSTSYLAAVLGLRHAAARGGDEGLFCAADGSYTEGTATALLAWDEGRLAQTPHGALPSVTAAAFTGAGEAPRRPLGAALLRAGGAVLLGSLTGAAPLLSLDGEPCARPAAMLARIADFNQQMIEGRLR